MTIQRFPFDSKTPIGYMVSFVLEYLMLMYVSYAVACILSIGFGAYSFIIAMTEDIKINVNITNDDIKIKKNRSKIVEQISDFIEIHSNAKQLSELMMSKPKFVLFLRTQFFMDFQIDKQVFVTLSANIHE